MFHDFIDFKKTLDRVWHAGLWQVPRSVNTEEGLVRAIRAVYENSNSAVLLTSQLGEIFNTTISVRQGCLLPPILFNFILEKVIQETLHDHHKSISIDERHVCNLRSADDIDHMGGSDGRLQDLSNRLIDRARSYGMEVSKEKTKIMTNSTSTTSHQCRYQHEWPEIRAGHQFEVPRSIPVGG